MSRAAAAIRRLWRAITGRRDLAQVVADYDAAVARIEADRQADAIRRMRAIAQDGMRSVYRAPVACAQIVELATHSDLLHQERAREDRR